MPQSQPGNIDLYDRPRVPNPKGGTSTVYSASFNIDGKEVLLPLSDEGRILSEDEAVAKYQRTGKHLGIFATPQDATSYAQHLHDDYAAGKYDRKQPMPQQPADPFAQYAVKDDPFAAYAAHAGPEPLGMSVMEAGRRSIGGHEGDPSTLERLNEALVPMAHPESVADVGALVLAPANLAAGWQPFKNAVRPMLRPVVRGTIRAAAAVGDTVSPDLVGAFSPRIGNAMRVAQRVRDAMPAAEGGALPPAGPHLDLSTPMRPSQMTPQQIAERVDAARAQGGVPTPAPPPRRMLSVTERFPNEPPISPPPPRQAVAPPLPPVPPPPQRLALPPGQYTGPQTLREPLALPGLPQRLALPPQRFFTGPQTLTAAEELAATAPQATPSVPPPTVAAPPVAGRLKRVAPVEAPAAPAPPLQVDVASLPESWKQFADQPPAAAPPVSHGPASAPKVVGKLRRFSSDLKGQPGPRGTVEDISSGVEAGSDEAAAMERMHRYDAETVNRYRFMMDNPNGAIGLMAGPTALAELIRQRLRGAAGRDRQ